MQHPFCDLLRKKKVKKKRERIIRHYQQKEQTCWLHVHVQLWFLVEMLIFFVK